MAQALRSICILRLSAIGDVCHAVSVVQAIQQHYPNAAITWVIGKIEAQLLAGLPGVKFVIFDKKQGLAAYRQLKEQLAAQQFDYLLHMQVALRANLASLCINARHKIGFDWHSAKELHALFMRERIEAVPQPHVLEGFRQFARAIGVPMQQPHWQMPLSQDDINWAAAQLQKTDKTEYSGPQRHFIICPAASKAERNWLPERYAAIAEYAAAQGFAVYLCGGPTAMEKQLAEDIQATCKTQLINLTGKTTLKQLLALLQAASLVLAPDTGPAHMAVTVGTPVIGLYGHSNPDRTGPYLYRQYVVEVYHQALHQQFGKTASQLKWGTRVKGSDIMSLISVAAVQQMFDKVVQEQKL